MVLGNSAMANRISSIGVVACGIVLAVVPLALWIAWSRVGFLIVLGVAAVSVVLLGALLSRTSAGDDDQKTGLDDEMRVTLPNEFVQEIHEISPLNYHHSRIEKARFRRTMDRLRDMIKA